MSRHHRRHQRFKLRSFYVWHRYMGLSAAAFALLIAVTGALLNHTEDFGFDSRHVQSDWILDWYGIEAPGKLLSYPAGDRQVTLVEDRLYLNRTEVEGDFRALHGAARLGDILVIAADDAILLLTPEGEVIERLRGGDSVPADIQQLGLNGGGTLVVRAAAGLFQSDSAFVRWTVWNGDTATVQWAQPAPLDAQLAASLRRQFRNSIMPLERVLLDLHSGRFFGRMGPWLFDIAALLLVLLALSGTWIWLKRKR